MQVSYGATERPLIFEASGKLDLGKAARFDVALAARQIDLDHTLASGAEQQVAIGAAVSTLVGKVAGIGMPPIPGKLHLEAQGVVVGGDVIQAVAADLSTGKGDWRVDDFSATLPGETAVDLAGSLTLSPEPAFHGHASVASRRPTGFAAWWRGSAGSAGSIGRFSLAADLDLKADDAQISKLVVDTANGALDGSADIKRFPQSGGYFVTVDLAADRADLVETRALAELLVGQGGAGKIEQMALSLSAGVLTAGGVEAHSVTLEGGFEDGAFDLRRLSVADLAGASIEALGSIRDPFTKNRSGSIEASIKAQDFAGAAEFLASLAPESRIARHLRDVAPILSPVSVDVSVDAGAAGAKLSVALNGSLGATHLSLDAEGKGSLGDPASLSGTLKLHADGEDSATVLRQIGLTPLPIRSTPMKLDATFDGALAKGGKLKLAGTVAGVDLSYDGETSIRDGEPAIAGAFKAESVDIDPALLLAGVAVPGIGIGHGASASGRLEYSGSTADIEIDEGAFNGKAMSGALEAAFAPDKTLSGEINLAGLSAPALVSFAVGTVPGVAEGGGWSDAPFAAALPQGIALDLKVNADKLDIGAPIAATEREAQLSALRRKAHARCRLGELCRRHAEGHADRHRA